MVKVKKIECLADSEIAAKRFFPDAEYVIRPHPPFKDKWDTTFRLFLDDGKVLKLRDTGYHSDGYPEETPTATWWRRTFIPRLKEVYGVEVRV